MHVPSPSLAPTAQVSEFPLGTIFGLCSTFMLAAAICMGRMARLQASHRTATGGGGGGGVGHQLLSVLHSHTDDGGMHRGGGGGGG